MDLHIKPFHECRVLVIDDELSSRIIFENLLSPHFIVKLAESAFDIASQCESYQPDLILLDMVMPEFDGKAACSLLKQSVKTKNIPVIFVTSSQDEQTQNECWEVGASDFVVKPVTPSTLIHRIKNQLQSKLRVDLLQKMTYKDPLTEVYNRVYLEQEVPHIIKQVNRDRRRLGVIVVDIDYFKKYNDTLGHLQGDKCLKEVASSLQKSLHRPLDRLIRFGGEEFLVLLPFVDEAGVITVAERLRINIAQLKLRHESSGFGHVTISAGATINTVSTTSQTNLTKLIDTADNALYKAKERGRNKVVFISET
ncbi:diguanylate cyclase [Alteromonas pelagimontana]|uniref:diguanylate cyclase n=1 Tax=Alteromonas pelagimontana TaxID=1858656 RepID=A0A6M4MAI8_9ALTE|nr:diguanylate cyclase [Alteromonas pelagimontana]QJR80182.1 diguanylate cyclase [Alteromonas pelagimontana]